MPLKYDAEWQTTESRPNSPSSAIIATLPVTASGHPGNLGLGSTLMKMIHMLSAGAILCLVVWSSLSSAGAAEVAYLSCRQNSLGVLEVTVFDNSSTRPEVAEGGHCVMAMKALLDAGFQKDSSASNGLMPGIIVAKKADKKTGVMHRALEISTGFQLNLIYIKPDQPAGELAPKEEATSKN